MVEALVRFKSVDQFRDYLKGYIDTSSWGQGNAKTADDLWSELKSGESGIVQEGNGILRITWPIFISVLYQNQGVLFELFEVKQIFHKDGRERVRSLPASIGEKGTSKDKPYNVAQKAIKEELEGKIPLSLRNSRLKQVNQWQEFEMARSYPNLQTRSNNVMFALNLMPNQGDPQPFTLHEAKKDSEFNWRRK